MHARSCVHLPARLHTRRHNENVRAQTILGGERDSLQHRTHLIGCTISSVL